MAQGLEVVEVVGAARPVAQSVAGLDVIHFDTLAAVDAASAALARVPVAPFCGFARLRPPMIATPQYLALRPAEPPRAAR